MLQGRGEVPGGVVPFDAASDVPVDEQRSGAMKRIQRALVAGDAGEAIALLRASR